MHGSADPLSQDEMSTGVGAAFSVIGLHLYVGLAYEHRYANHDAVIELGVPILDHF